MSISSHSTIYMNLQNKFIHSHASVLKALIYGVATKGWGVLNIPMQLVLISLFFSQELQGFYYTFLALQALQIFVELGLSSVVIHYTAHEWSKLSLTDEGHIEGSVEAQDRLAQFGRGVLIFYGIGACLLAFFLISGGSYFLAKQPASFHWQLPWIAFSMAAGLHLFLLPALAFLDGANEVNTAYFIRFGQSIIMGLTTALSIICGFELWTCSLSLIASILWTLSWVAKKYFHFFKIFFLPPKRKVLSWKKEVLPLQWRIALTFVSGFFAFSLFNPLVFYFKGSVDAGKLGMTLVLTQAVTNFSALWMNVYTPQFGALIALKKQNDFQNLFSQTYKLTWMTCLLTSAVAWVSLRALTHFGIPLAERLLPFPTLEGFLIGNFCYTITVPYSLCMRAHKQEPLLIYMLCYATLMALTAYVTTRFFSLNHLSCAFLSINLGAVFCVRGIWKRFTEKVALEI